MRKAEREGKLRERVKFLSRYSLLVVDEIGYLPVGSGGGNLFFQLVNACYERCAMIMTGNRGFGEWADIFGDAVVATALLDRLLHHAVVIPIEGNSYRLREHANLLPEHLRPRVHRPCASTHPPSCARASQEGGLPILNAVDLRTREWGILLRRFWGKFAGVDKDLGAISFCSRRWRKCRMVLSSGITPSNVNRANWRIEATSWRASSIPRSLRPEPVLHQVHPEHRLQRVGLAAATRRG